MCYDVMEIMSRPRSWFDTVKKSGVEQYLIPEVFGYDYMSLEQVWVWV